MSKSETKVKSNRLKDRLLGREDEVAFEHHQMTEKTDRELYYYLLKKRSGKKIFNFFFLSLVLALCFTILYPLLKTVPNVFSDMRDLGDPDIIWLPKRFATTSFKAAYRMMMTFGSMTMLYSVIYALTVMLIQVMMAAMAGYSLARVQFRGSNLIYMLVILTFLVPPQSLLISQYLHFKDFNPLGIVRLLGFARVDLTNNPATLYIMNFLGFGLNQGLFIFIFRQFFIGLPKEIEEAALIDGCGFYRTYFRIMLPNAKPSFLIVAVLSFVWNYGDTYLTGYFDPNGPYLVTILTRRLGSQNQNFVIEALQHWYSIPTSSVFMFDAVKQAAALIYIIPLLVVYFLTQRQLVENLEMSGIVG